MKEVVVVGDSFSGEIKIGGKVYAISGTWTDAGQSNVTANGKGVIIEGSKGTYICPVDGAPETVTALSSSTLQGINGKKLHLKGDSVIVDSHENISVVTTSGQSNVTSM